MKKLISLAIAFAVSPAIASPHHHHTHPAQSSSTSSADNSLTNNVNGGAGGQGGVGGKGGSSSNSVDIENNSTYNSIPNIVGPVPRGFVPVLSFYGQMDYQQRGTYGAQISIPLAR